MTGRRKGMTGGALGLTCQRRCKREGGGGSTSGCQERPRGRGLGLVRLHTRVGEREPPGGLGRMRGKRRVEKDGWAGLLG